MYTAWSVIAGEVPTALKWNILGLNDAGFRDGTNIADDVIGANHLSSDVSSLNKISGGFLTYDATSPARVSCSVDFRVAGNLFVGGFKAVDKNTSGGLDYLRLNPDNTYNGGVIATGNMQVTGNLTLSGNLNHKGFDFSLGTGDQISRGNTGLSRVMVKDSGGRLTINYANDFYGGVNLLGNLYMQGHVWMKRNAIYMQEEGDTNHWVSYQPSSVNGTDGVYIQGYQGVVLRAGSIGGDWQFKTHDNGVHLNRDMWLNGRTIRNMYTSVGVGGGVIGSGGTIPLPAYMDESECAWTGGLSYCWAGSHVHSICGVDINFGGRQGRIYVSKYNVGWVEGGEIAYFIAGRKG